MIHSFMGNDHVFWLVVNGLGRGSASPRSYGVEIGPGFSHITYRRIE